MADKETIERKDDDADDSRRQFIARFGKLAVVAAPTVAVLVTSMDARAACPSGFHLNPQGKCVANQPGS
jgi:hypothetical protein